MKHLSVKFIQAVANALNGKFGKRVLRQPYRNYYRVVAGFILVSLVWNYVAVPFFGWWDGVIRMFNYVIWG